jgi:putative ABC transport system ATP-binding protein
MAFINQANKKVTARIIYYGPDQAGKNASLLYVYHHSPEQKRGKLVSLATDQGSKVSFEYHPDHFDSSTYEFIVQLNTVSGQVTNDLLRQALVNGADGCVFVADMQPSSQFANFKCYQNLEEDLRACGRTLKEFPLIIQYNKKDLQNVLPVGKMNLFLNSYNVQFFESCATTGEGIFESLNCITALVWNDLNKKGILIGAAHTIAKNKAATNEGGLSIIRSSEENSAVALLHEAHATQIEHQIKTGHSESFDELEPLDVSSDPGELEIDYENPEMDVFPFEENFEDELLELADKIGPKADLEAERDNTQKLEPQPPAEGSENFEEVFADVEEPVAEGVKNEEVLTEPEEAAVPETLQLDTPPVETPDSLEVPGQPDTPAVPDVGPDTPMEAATHAMPDSSPTPESPHEDPTPAAPEPFSVPVHVTPQSLEATLPPVHSAPVAPQLLEPTVPPVQQKQDLPAATAALFAGDIRTQVLFSYLENAISAKDFGTVKTVSDQLYSYLLDRLSQKKGVDSPSVVDASKWLNDLGITLSQQSLYQKAVTTLSANQTLALSDLFLIHYFLLTFHTKLSSFPEFVAPTAKKLVSIERVSKRYTLGNYQVQALKNVTMDVKDGEFLAIAGPSGSGKTTLLNLIGCIDSPSGGTITIEDRVVNGLSSNELADLRARAIGFIFQTFNLLPVLSAAENVEYPLLQIEEVSKQERRDRVNHCLSVVGLSNVSHHKPNELSGGQRQRVAIARALASHPKIILADEPTANLDTKTGESILQLMKQINRTEKTTFIFSTHDPRVMELADRVVRMNDGEVINS